MSDVWRHSAADGLDRLVLLAIADNANDEDGAAWPSILHLAAKTRLHRTTVLRSVRRLETLGELVVTRSFGRGSRYRIRIEPVAPCATGSGERPVAESDHTGSGERLVPVAESDRTSRSGATLNHQEPSGEPSREPSVPRTRVRRRLPSTALADDWTLDEKLRGYAGRNGIDWEIEFPKFRAHHQAVGSCFANWGAAWRKGVIIAWEQKQRRHGGRP